MVIELDPSSLDRQDLPRGPRLNLAIGPNCPVRCEGCYNNFGDTFNNGGLVTAAEITDFATDIRDRDIDGATLSGGDPLYHPEIKNIISGLYDLGFRIKIDTVGTALLRESKIAFKGKGEVQQLFIEEISDKIESITIPIDGIDQETVYKFRKGRKNLFDETLTISRLLRESDVTFDFNTVVNLANIDQIELIGRLALSLGAITWHVFEYDTTGPNPSQHKDDLALIDGQFLEIIENLNSLKGNGMRLDIRTQESRIGEGAYFFVNDAGVAWSPTGQVGLSSRFGHITRDREKVLSAYDNHITAFWEKFSID